MIKTSNSKKSKENDEFSESKLSKKNDLVKCKFCNTKLAKSDHEEKMKYPLEEKWGIWGGVEYPYIQLYNVQCPSPDCRKKYSVKLRKSTWFYK